ncbi:MAG TPA: CrcB family protein [Dermatophilaceae bacterium]|nr:CrcB family protein [Dermatophilaceae bacterium]
MTPSADEPTRRPPGLAQTVRERRDVLAVIAAGGALGSAARWALGTALPHRPGELPVATWLENVTGAAALGVLMVLVTEVWPARRYVRPFWGVGVLGGYTTFSTYMLDTHALFLAGRPLTAVGYSLGTLLTGLPAAWAGIAVARALTTRSTRRAARRGRHTTGREQ